MPPKKAAANSEASEGAFKWEGANDFKLLLLTQGRYVMPDEYEQLSSVFPGTKVGSIRNRISVLRIKQRELYDSLGWTLPDASTAAKKTPASKKAPRKRGVDNDNDDEDAVPDTPSKKPRAIKVKKSAVRKEAAGASGGETDGAKEMDGGGETVKGEGEEEV